MRIGSLGSGGSGLPKETEQNPQFLVQTFPRISTVAVPLSQHSPRFGQFALLHIVSRDKELKTFSVFLKLSPAGKGRLNQVGKLRFLEFLFCVVCCVIVLV
jgi:hypothetical protein